MPDQRLERARKTLAADYQFGDAGDGIQVILVEPDEWLIRVPWNVRVMTKRYLEHD